MTGKAYTVILVRSTSHALRAEKVLGEGGITCKLIPVPRQISSECGVCVRVERIAAEEACRALAAAHVAVVGIDEIERL